MTRGEAFSTAEEFARQLDEADDLASFRKRFEVPGAGLDPPRIYLLGNSLGPPTRGARDAVEREIDAWAVRGVGGYFDAPSVWRDLDIRHRRIMADLVGAIPHEVALMNGLTVNLHLLLASFYRPAGSRTKILVESRCFPSDRYAVDSQVRWHGLDPAATVIEAGGSVERALAERGHEIALVWLGGVNYLTGELLDMERITERAHAAGCQAGFDLAHAAGNVPLRLHDWNVDFAAWCTYKYLNAGPGGPAAVFVRDSHGSDPDRFRLGGWWGNDPDLRFGWREVETFRPRPGAAGWQLSCPAVLAFAPLGPALDVFAEAGMERIRRKSRLMTGYLEWMLREFAGDALDVLTPAEPEARGAQLSLQVNDAGGVCARLAAAGVDMDAREPDVVRLAPAPLFNTFHEVWRAARLVADALRADAS